MKQKTWFLILFCVQFVLQSKAQNPGFAVVELFTSEGCSSCPPADQVLSKILTDAEKNHRNIFPLSFHVDYWNRLGWKDPYSKNQFTFRQENYSRILPGKELYTPQMVVNGETDFTGSNESKAKAVIDDELKKAATVSVTLSIDSVIRDTAFVAFTSSKLDKNFVFRFAISENGLSSQVSNGENKGKLLKHDAVVRIFFSLDNFQEKGQVKIPLAGFKPKTDCALTGFVQHKQSLKILGASRIGFH